ncbi:hypothetical protein CBS101457_000434 [Exobasidium rhododendri]|nr:hypothetical protein CBS101457_000434 [Exobasidium rhododendri]
MSLNRNKRSGPSLPTYYSQSVGNSRDAASLARAKARAGPNRSTKASGKLKILPEEPEDGVNVITDNKGIARLDGDGEDEEDSSEDEESGSGDLEQRARIFKQLELARIPEGSMRRDAKRITRRGRASLPRVTAYSTATSYRMRELTKWLQGRRETHRTNVMTFDECVYTTYSYDLMDQIRGGHGQDHHHHIHSTAVGLHSSSSLKHRGGGKESSSHRGQGRTGDLLGIPELHDEQEVGRNDTDKKDEVEGDDVETEANGDSSNNGASTTTLVDVGENGNDAKDAHSAGDRDDTEVNRKEEESKKREQARQRRKERFAVHGMIPEIFFMEYGAVVIWGMTLAEEKKLLRELRKFEVERLAQEDVESEDLNWYLADYSRIYNDVITLRRGSSYMTKLSLSHALAQSTKISFFEGVIDNTIDTTKDIPQSIAESGKIGLPPVEIMKQIGHLFILRMNIHLVGSIVDSPEIFWAQPDLEPLYSAARSYLEIPQRIDLLNARVEVLQDMLQLLKDQVTSSHSEWLEIIVIILILLEIVLGVLTMVIDLVFA